MDQIQQSVSSGYSTFQSATVMVILATMAVIIRLVSKTFTKARFSLDDYWIVLTLAAFWTYLGLLCWAVFKAGGGLDMRNLREFDFAAILLYVEALLVGTTFFVLVSTTTKISILLYYRRIFAIQTYKRATLALSVVTGLTWLTSELGICLQCFPLRSVWDPFVAGHCMDFNVFVLVMGLIDLLLDISILCLPMSIISRLNLSLRRKISLALIFLLGGFVCITAIVRLAVIYNPGGEKINFVRGILWSNIHLGTAIICACLPTYRPVFSKCADGLANIQQQYKSWLSSKQERNSSRLSPYMIDGRESQKPRSDLVSSSPDDQEYNLGVVKGINYEGEGEGERERDFARGDDYPPNHIIVESTTSVV